MRSACVLLAILSPADTGLPTATFDTRTDPHYGDARVPIRTYLQKPYIRARRGPQHFCVIGYVDEDGGRNALVHWREGKKILPWPGAVSAEWRADAIVLAPHKLDLMRDVVPAQADIGGSSYLVTRAWVAQVLADCRAHGTRYVVRR